MLNHYSHLAIGSDFAQTYQDTNPGGTSFAGFVTNIIGVVNALITLLIAVAVLLFFVGLVRYVYHSDNMSEKRRGNELMRWGLVALFILMSLWGILDVAKTSIFPS